MKLKISYSLINMWKRGDRAGVLDALEGRWRPPTPAMQYGTDRHKEWELETKKTGKLPEIFGGNKLISPKAEKYHKKQILDWLWLSGIVDLEYVDPDTGLTVLLDYKTGKGKASQYTNTLQGPVYKLFVPEAKMFRYLCYNQHTDTITTAYTHLTDETADRALKEVVEVACDIRATLEAMGKEDFDNVNKSSRKK